MSRTRVPVSLVSVWNNESVRAACLDRSIALLRGSTPDLEYLPVDNRGQRHPTAGGALNEGVRAASRDVVVFVQQDIHLHSLVAIEEAAGLLMQDEDLWMAGAVGIDELGRIRGRIRDRVALIGERREVPQPVDSLDEVLFLARRRDLLASPLSEDSDLAWHAYGVEWGLRGRETGRQVVAVDIPLTHNSLSTNMANLDVAHAAVAARHPTMLPLQTTCGRITKRGGTRAGSRFPALDGHRWRFRRVVNSWAARPAIRATASRDVVLSDLRWDIDRIAEHVEGEFRVHNVVASRERLPEEAAGTRLPRVVGDVIFSSGPLSERPVPSAPGDAVVWTNLSPTDLATLRPLLARTPHVLGVHPDAGHWVLLGAVTQKADQIWTDQRSRPARLLV